MRFQRPLGAAVYALLGAYLAASPEEPFPWRAVMTAAAVVGLTTSFGFVINDYCDVAVDKIGRPQRPIPSGRVSRRAAGAFASLLAFLAFAISVVLGAELALIALIALALSGAYSFRLKGTLLLGNATVALLVAAVLFYGALASGQVTPAVVAAAAITFPYILGQEALFDLEDEEQDRRAGLATTATRLGLQRGAKLVRIVLLVFAALAVTPWLVGQASLGYLVAMAVLVLGPTVVVFRGLRSPLSLEALGRAARWSRLAWVTSLIPLAMLK